jgi:uncharacterized protein (TIGR02145 family)
MNNYLILLLLAINFSVFSQEKDTLTDARDGQKYEIVKIENRWWMAQNMNFIGVDESYCYDDDSMNCIKFGRLYSFETAKQVCPNGWKLPTDSDANELIAFLRTKYGSAFNGLTAKQNSGFNPGTSGFKLLNDEYRNIGITSYFWLTCAKTGDPMRLLVSYRQRGANIDTAYDLGYLSVRCIKTDSSD